MGEIGEQLARVALHDPRSIRRLDRASRSDSGGGRALNIVPAECLFDFEVRALADFDTQQVVEQLAGYAESLLLPPTAQSDP